MLRDVHPRPVVLAVASVMVGTMAVVGCGHGFPGGRIDAVDAGTGASRWDAEVEHPLVAAASVSDGLLLIWGRDRCDGPAHLVASDARSGENVWAGDPVDASGPLEVDVSGEVVVGADRDDLVAWAVASGEEQWRARVAGDVDVQIGADDAGIVSSATNTSLAAARITDHDPVTGHGRWSVSLEAGRQVIDVALTTDLVLVRTWGSTDPALTPSTEVQALERTDGATRWRADLGVSETATPLVVTGDVVLAALSTIAFSVPDATGGTRDVGPSSSVVALDVDDGDVRWRLDRSSPALSDLSGDASTGVALFDADASTVIGRDGSALVGWDAATGTERWRTELGAGDAWVASQLVVATDLVPSDRSSFPAQAYDLSTGQPGWTIRTRRPVVSVSADESDLVIVQTGDGPGCSD